MIRTMKGCDEMAFLPLTRQERQIIVVQEWRAKVQYLVKESAWKGQGLAIIKDTHEKG